MLLSSLFHQKNKMSWILILFGVWCFHYQFTLIGSNQAALDNSLPRCWNKTDCWFVSGWADCRLWKNTHGPYATDVEQATIQQLQQHRRRNKTGFRLHCCDKQNRQLVPTWHKRRCGDGELQMYKYISRKKKICFLRVVFVLSCKSLNISDFGAS